MALDFESAICNQLFSVFQFSRWQLIQNLLPSTIMLRQCDIQMGKNTDKKVNNAHCNLPTDHLKDPNYIEFVDGSQSIEYI